jgi:DNA-binding MarR family transcriptional regulator
VSKKQMSVLNYLWMVNLRPPGDPKVVSPTEVGMKVGGRSYEKASSWASPTLKRMVVKGLVHRTKDAKYGITDAGEKEMKVGWRR